MQNFNRNTSIFELLDSLTIHGLPNIFRTKLKSIKLLWVSLFIASTLFTTYFIRQTIIEYVEFNVVTVVRLIDKSQMEFPTLTLCNKNQFSSKNLTLEYLKNHFRTLESLLNDDAHKLFKDINVNDRKFYTLSLEEMVLSCRIDNKPCNLSEDFEYMFHKTYGNCYRFNYKEPIKMVTRSSVKYGLILELNLTTPEDLEKLNNNSDRGIHLSINKINVNPFVNYGNLIDVSAGVETKIAVERLIFDRQPYPYGQCEYLEGMVLDDSKYFKQIIESNYYYTRTLCEDYCKVDLALLFCNCTIAESSMKIPNEKICTNSSSKAYKCAEKIETQIPNYKDVCSKSCPSECLKIRFNKYVTTSKIKLNNRYSKMRETDYLVLKVHFNSMSDIVYKEMPAMNTFQLVSNLGGTLGLFLGNSN